MEDGRTEWRLVPRSVADGAPVAASGWTFTEQVLLIRLLGWTPLGEPVIAAYGANPDLRHAERWSIDSATELVRVLALSGDGPRPLITPTGAVQSIDVADQAIASGLVRPGALTHRRLGPFLWDLGAKLAVLVLLVFLGRRLWVRWQEYRRRA